MDFDTVISRLKTATSSKYDKDIATVLDMTVKSFSERRRRNSIPLEKIKFFCLNNSINLDWILTGQGDMYLPSREKPEQNGLTYIPCYDVRVSAGGGAFVDAEQTHQLIAMKTEVLRDKFSVAGKDLFCVTVVGDSMEPTLYDGDMVMVNNADTAPGRDGIYVFRTDQGLFVKRLQVNIDGKFRIISDNKMYDSYDLRPDMAESFMIFGRVIWFLKKAR